MLRLLPTAVVVLLALARSFRSAVNVGGRLYVEQRLVGREQGPERLGRFALPVRSTRRQRALVLPPLLKATPGHFHGLLVVGDVVDSGLRLPFKFLDLALELHVVFLQAYQRARRALGESTVALVRCRASHAGSHHCLRLRLGEGL